MEWTEAMQKELRQASRHDPRPYVRTKALALLNLARKRPVAEVAAVFEVSRQAVYDWTAAYGRRGVSGLRVQKGRGRKPTAELPEIQRYVRQSPRAFGYDRTRWTLSLLAQAVPSLRGFSAYGVQKALRRAGITYKRGQPWLHSPDPQYEEKNAIDQALQEAREHPDQVVLLYQDEGTFYRQPTQASLWANQGRQQPRLPYSHRSNTRLRMIGYLNAVNGAVMTQDMSRVTADRLARNVRTLSPQYPHAQRIYLVWDNWPVHEHPKVQAALAQDARLQVLPLPTYAPWLNPIEKTWRWERQRVSHAHPWSDDFPTFKQQLRDDFGQLATGSLEHLRYVGLSN